MAALSQAALTGARRRSLLTLLASVALGSTGYIMASSVAAIVAADLTDTAAWAGVPGATAVIGSAVGSALLSVRMARTGRRGGLTLGYLLGALGALLAAAAVVTRSFPLFLLATPILGVANSSNLLSRYAAADMYLAARRASAIGMVVWGATVGAVLGPNLVTVAGELGQGLGLPALAGAYVLLAAFVGAAALVCFLLLRPDPYELAEAGAVDRDADPPVGASVGDLLRRPAVVVALGALVVGQVVMVLIMTVTPVHMTAHGHGLGEVGIVLSGHAFGMFALSPLSGRLTDRLGSLPVIYASTATLGAAALLSSLAPPDGGAVLFVALFLLGFGWNLGFVAGSALLARGLERHERTRLEGVTDALIWGSAAAASLSSGILLATAGYTALGLLALVLLAIPVALLVARRRGSASAARAPGEGPA